MSRALFFRLFFKSNKASALSKAIAELREGNTDSETFIIDTRSFTKVPGTPFSYWVSDNVRHIFEVLSALGGNGRVVQHGLSTKDDFRFIRTRWEVPSDEILDGLQAPNWPIDVKGFQEWCLNRTFEGKHWVPFAKGGYHSPFHADVHLLVDWERNGETLEQHLVVKYPYLKGNTNWVLHRECEYFREGLTWPRRTTSGISVRALPKGCIFADKGPTVFTRNEELGWLLALMNSQAFEGLVALQLGAADVAARSYEVGLVQSTPVPDLSESDSSELTEIALMCVDIKRQLDRANETSAVFHLPALLQVPGNALEARYVGWHTKVVESEKQLAENKFKIDDLSFRLYGIGQDDRRAIEESFGIRVRLDVQERPDAIAFEEEEDAAEPILDARHLVAELCSYFADIWR